MRKIQARTYLGLDTVGVVDAGGGVWEWLDELITRAEHATNAD